MHVEMYVLVTTVGFWRLMTASLLSLVSDLAATAAWVSVSSMELQMLGPFPSLSSASSVYPDSRLHSLSRVKRKEHRPGK